jgi:hypothetical protein
MWIGLFFLGSLVLLWAGILVGHRVGDRHPQIVDRESKIIGVLEGALLTLFGLLMGFTFSMAVSRYDARKALVVKEANAIETTWLRSATLSDPLRGEQQSLLREYVKVRLRVHGSPLSGEELRENMARTDDLQHRLWAIASSYAADHRDTITGLYVATTNEMIDTAAERIAAEENRIPVEAWVILLFVGVSATLVVGVNVRSRSKLLQAVLPVVLAGTLALTLDLDSPHQGMIQVDQQSVERLAQDMAAKLPQQAP